MSVCWISLKTSPTVLYKMPGESPNYNSQGTQDIKGTLSTSNKKKIKGNIIAKATKLQLPVLISTPGVESKLDIILTSKCQDNHLSCKRHLFPKITNFLECCFLLKEIMFSADRISLSINENSSVR